MDTKDNNGHIVSVRFNEFEYSQLLNHSSKKSMGVSAYIKRSLNESCSLEANMGKTYDISSEILADALKDMVGIRDIIRKNRNSMGDEVIAKIDWRIERLWDALR